MTPGGLEPRVTGLKGRGPRPLDDGAKGSDALSTGFPNSDPRNNANRRACQLATTSIARPNLVTSSFSCLANYGLREELRQLLLHLRLLRQRVQTLDTVHELSPETDA